MLCKQHFFISFSALAADLPRLWVSREVPVAPLNWQIFLSHTCHDPSSKWNQPCGIFFT